MWDFLGRRLILPGACVAYGMCKSDRYVHLWNSKIFQLNPVVFLQLLTNSIISFGLETLLTDLMTICNSFRPFAFLDGGIYSYSNIPGKVLSDNPRNA